MCWRGVIYSRESRFQPWKLRISAFTSQILLIKGIVLHSYEGDASLCVYTNVWVCIYEVMSTLRCISVRFTEIEDGSFMWLTVICSCAHYRRDDIHLHTACLCRSDRWLCFSIWEIRRMGVMLCLTLTLSSDLSPPLSLSMQRSWSICVFARCLHWNHIAAACGLMNYHRLGGEWKAGRADRGKDRQVDT